MLLFKKKKSNSLFPPDLTYELTVKSSDLSGKEYVAFFFNVHVKLHHVF